MEFLENTKENNLTIRIAVNRGNNLVSEFGGTYCIRNERFANETCCKLQLVMCVLSVCESLF